MSGIRPRVTLPLEAVQRPPQVPGREPSQRELDYARLLPRARRRTWLVMLAGLLLLAAGGADIVTADSGGLVLAGVVPVLLGLAACVLAERRLARLAHAAGPRRGRRSMAGDEGGPGMPELDRVRWESMAWFHFGHGDSDGGGGGGFWSGFGGGDFGGGGGDGGGC